MTSTLSYKDNTKKNPKNTSGSFTTKIKVTKNYQ